MNKKFTKLIAALALLAFMTPSLAGWGQTKTDYEAVITFNCAYASSIGNSTIYGGSASTSMGPGHIKTFLNNAAGSEVIPNYPSSYSSVYWAKGSGGSGIPDNVLKIGTASGSGNCTFTIADSFDEISKVSITGYGWKNTTKVAVNGSATQSPSAAATLVTFDYVLSEATRTIAINITTSAFCATEIVLYKEAASSVYTVTYDCNGGTSDCPEDVTGIDPENNEITLAAAPSKTGYTFDGWNDGTNTYAAGYVGYHVTGNVTMTAQWTVNTYNVTVQGNAYGTVTGYSNPVAYGTEVTLVYTHNDGEYYGATFASDDVTITDGTFTMPDNVVTITVTEYELPKYTVTFSDGGSLTETQYGAGVTLPDRSGDGTYTFVGWTTSNIASETPITPDPILTGTYYPTSDITLYPVYTRTEGSGYKWQKITDLSTITDGIYALLTTDGHAFNGTISSGHGGVTETAFSFTNNEATAAPEGTCEITMVSVTGGYKMYNSSQGYLYAKAASSKNLAWHDSESSYWFYGNNNWKYNSNGAYLRSYENGSFRTYGSNSGDVMVMAKKVSNSITYYVSSLTFVAVPTFNPTSQNFSTASLSVAISAESGCVIRYTTDNWEHEIETPSNTITIELSGTTTVKAMAKNGSDLSAEVSETYTRVYSVALISNGVEKSIEEVVPTESISLSAPDNVPQGFTFMGWTADPSTPNTLVNTEYTPTGNVTLYASFAKIISSSYDKVTSASDMTEGEYIIATYYGSKYYTIKSNTEVSSNPVAHEQAVTNNAITGDVTELTWSFTGTSDAMAIKSTTQNLYLNTTNSSTGVKINTTDDDSWTISYNSTDNYFSMKSKNGGGSRYLSVFISGGTPQDWRNYASGTTNSYQQITLFKKNAIVSTDWYIRVFQNETATAAIEIVGPSIIPSGTVLDMGNFTLTSNNPDNLIIEDGGILITHNTVKATVKKNIEGATHWGAQPENPDEHYTPDGWYFITSPAIGASYGTATTSDYDLYMLDWPSKKWLNKQVAANSTQFGTGFQLGTGYLYASKDGNMLSLAGEIQPLSNNNTATVTLANDGWNLIGNPLTCKVTVDHEFGLLNNGSTVDYTGTIVNPCQGIVVWGNANDVVTFTKAATQNAAAPGNSSLQMTVAQNVVTRGNATSTTVDNAVISFNEGSVLPKFTMLESNANLYIPQGIEEYAIVSSEAQGTMPVNFRANENGNYTLTVNAENVEMNYLHLIDNMTGADIDLLANPSYSFEARTTDFESRFKLVFASSANGNENDNENFAFFSNGNLIIANEGQATLQLIDINGRVLSSETVNGSVSKAVNATPGIYMLRLINGENVKVQKIVVR